jgi:hypothetical protein
MRISLKSGREGGERNSGVESSSHFFGGCSRHGLTILEMLVATTLLALIILGLTAMFVQTQKAFKVAIRQSDVTDGGRTITDIITHDLSQLSDAKGGGITNLFFGWSLHSPLEQKVQTGATLQYFTNELDDFYFLIHTNNTWAGIGYFVIDQAPGVGTLYRYSTATNASPQIFSNSLFQPYIFLLSGILSGATNANVGAIYYPIADGVTHLKLRTYDQNGNEPYAESSTEFNGGGFVTYPLTPFNTNLVTNALPHFVDLEVGVLEPETYSQVKALSVNPIVQSNFLVNAAGATHIFRQHILIPEVYR